LFDIAGVFGGGSLTGDAFTAVWTISAPCPACTDSTVARVSGGSFYGTASPVVSAVLTIAGHSVVFGPGIYGVMQENTDEETSAFIKLSQDFLKNGDFSSGRLLLKRAANAGSAAAALLLGETFDPLLVQRLGVIGVQPDVAEAREWYQRAAQLGSSTAAQHLATLAAPR
jgi:hypothetical protein